MAQNGDNEPASPTEGDEVGAETHQPTDATAEPDALDESDFDDVEPERRIGWRKGLIVVVAVVAVWTVVESQRRIGWEIPWASDLDECLAQAQDPRKAVVLLVHKRDCPLTEEFDRTVFNLRSTYNWATGGIPCRLIWEEHPEVVRKYHLRESPSLLCLNPEGEDIFRWAGREITPKIRKRFLKYVVGYKDETTYRKQPNSTRPADTSP